MAICQAKFLNQIQGKFVIRFLFLSFQKFDQNFFKKLLRNLHWVFQGLFPLIILDKDIHSINNVIILQSLFVILILHQKQAQFLLQKLHKLLLGLFILELIDFLFCLVKLTNLYMALDALFNVPNFFINLSSKLK